MAIAFVKNLFAGSAKGTTSSLVLSGSAVVSAGNTIFVSFGTSDASNPITVTDNLGNTYSLISAQQSASVVVGRLYRADITNPGTLTAITISQTPGFPVFGAIAVEFSGVGTQRFTGGMAAVASAINAYPGTNTSTTGTYTAGDLWIGAYAQRSSNTFGSGGGTSPLAAVEPTAEQRTTGSSSGTNVSVGLLYYISASGATGALQGTFSASADAGAAGAVFAARVGGPTFNDTVAGAIVFTGTRVESWRHNYIDAGTGAFALAGTVVESNVVRIIYTDSRSGSLVFTGSVVESAGKTFTDARTGSLALSGTISESFLRADAPSGSVALSGTAADVWFIHVAYSDAPAGSIGIAGAATEIRRGNDNPVGQFAIAGTATEGIRRVEAPVTGDFQLYGWAAKTLSSVTPRPVGIPGAMVRSGSIIVQPQLLRPPMPKNYAVGDLIICFGAAQGSASLTSVSPGWTRIPNTPLVAKVAQSLEEQSPVLTFNTDPGGSGSPVAARAVAFRAVDTSDMATVADVVGVADFQSLVAASTGGKAITTPQDNDLVLSLTNREIGASLNRYNPPSGFGLVTWDFVDSGVRMSFAWAYQAKHPQGAVAAPVFSVSTSDPTSYQTAGIVVALKALPSLTFTDAATGMVQLSGSNVEHWGHKETPQGTLPFAGTVVESYDAHRPESIGRLPLTGTVQESWTHTGARTGSIALTGSVIENYYFVDVVAGAVSVSGAVEESWQWNIFDDCSGRLRLSGSVSYRIVFNDSVSGRVNMRGTKSEFIEIEGEIFYDDFTTGAIELEGRVVFVNESITPGRNGRIVGALGSGRIVKNLGAGRTVGNLTGNVTT